MPDGTELRDYACPKCGARARLDPRFIQWCTECGHGADPKPPELGKREQRGAEREYERSRRLFESLRTAGSLRPTSVTGVYVTLLSGVVHLITLAVLVLPILLVVETGGAVWSYVLLGFCLLTFAVVRPRPPRRYLDPSRNLDRETAPRFYELLDRCAAELGCPVPAQIRFDAEFNASTGRSGLRQRSYLLLGMPLWTVLGGQERIALLGHELAHQINGDTTHGLWASTARRSLDAWTKLLDPRQTNFESSTAKRTARASGRRAGAGGLGALLAPLLMGLVFLPFFAIALGCRALLTRLDLYCGQRAEYLADELGARLAGSEAATGLMATLALSEPAGNFVVASKNKPRAQRAAAADGLWGRMVEYMDSIPETERQRRAVVDRLRNTRTDRSHPANHLRGSLIAARPQLPGVLKVSEGEWAAIDAELAAAYDAAARELVESA
ncbi:MAG TPA: M48 family metalloprotease [Actinospica sp.]|jgi:Zn-dependent protease with chaperone function|nr:M48 family metalloprotease [Actinospica sp.]